MFEGRTWASRKNTPRVYIEMIKFPFLKELEIGDEGIVEVEAEILGIRLEMDSDNNERMIYNFDIKTMKPFNEEKEKRDVANNARSAIA